MIYLFFVMSSMKALDFSVGIKHGPEFNNAIIPTPTSLHFEIYRCLTGS